MAGHLAVVGRRRVELEPRHLLRPGQVHLGEEGGLLPGEEGGLLPGEGGVLHQQWGEAAL